VYGQFISFFSPPEKFPLLPCRAETSRLRTGRLFSDLHADGSSEFLNAKLPSPGEPDPLALRRAFQQLQVFLEQLIHQVCHWLSRSLGQALWQDTEKVCQRRSF
jgi:hypothetical protein